MQAPSRERLDETDLREGRLKHAIKVALSCCLAATLAFYFQLPSHQLSAVFAFMLLALGMPSPRLNWLMTHVTTIVSSIVSALILINFYNAPLLYLVLTLTWIFVCILFANWFPLPAGLGAMASAIGLFTAVEGTIGGTIDFFFAYQANLFLAGLSVTLVYSLLWPNSLQKTFMQRLAQVYARLEEECREAARTLRTGQAPAFEQSLEDWAPFRPLRKMLAPDTHRAEAPVDPFLRMIVSCRNLNMRLWFFNQSIAPAVLVQLPATAHHHLADMLDQCADHLHRLLECLVLRQPAPPVAPALIAEATFPNAGRQPAPATVSDTLLAHGVHRTLMNRLVNELTIATDAHNVVVRIYERQLPGELVAVRAFAVGKRLVDAHSVRSGVKLLILLLLLLGEELYLGLPGSSQVAFFAVFFASTANLGKQNRSDVLGVTGLLCGFAFGVLAAHLTTRIPQFPLVLAFVFLGEMIASLVFQSFPKYGVAGLQAGMALPFAYLAATGPGWGSFDQVRTRFFGLVLAGCTAIVVHAYFWPVWPLKTLRRAIAQSLRDTAESVRGLFAEFTTWQGPPPSLGETFHQAHDLLEDARYLPGTDDARGCYNHIIAKLQEIDGFLEQARLLLNQDGEGRIRRRFFQDRAAFAEQAAAMLEKVARQFDGEVTEAVNWSSTLTTVVEQSEESDEHRRLIVVAECLEAIARSATALSRLAADTRLI